MVTLQVLAALLLLDTGTLCTRVDDRCSTNANQVSRESNIPGANFLQISHAKPRKSTEHWQFDHEGTKWQGYWRGGAVGHVLLQARHQVPQSPLNLCVENHLVPELFLIGAQKSATTCLASELSEGSSFIRAPGLGGNEAWGLHAKEPHVFDYKDNFHKGRGAWLARYPACPPYRAVASDMTPMLHIEAVPARIGEWYGQDSQRLTFVVLLRDPLARMQSAFHHSTKHFASVGSNYSWINASFQQYVSHVLLDPTYCEKRELTGIPEDVDAFCDSLYAHQLAAWFAHFSGSQFLVVPFKYVVDRTNETSSVADALFTRLGIPGNHSQLVAGQLGVHGSHGSIDEELSSDSHMKLQKLLWKLSGADKVAKLLVEHGANLYDPVGESSGKDERTQADVAEWLARNW